MICVHDVLFLTLRKAISDLVCEGRFSKIVVHLFISHTFHISMKEKKPAGQRTHQKHIHPLAVYNKFQIHVMGSKCILPFAFLGR